MGVLPLQFRGGDSVDSLGLDGTETFDIGGIADGLAPGSELGISVTRADGKKIEFRALVRLDTSVEVEYYRHGGILQYVLRQLSRS